MHLCFVNLTEISIDIIFKMPYYINIWHFLFGDFYGRRNQTILSKMY